MVAVKIGGQPPQVDKDNVSINEKMLELAQDLFIEELLNDTLFACGDDFTSKVAGNYGLYETFDGEVVCFQPKPNLKFTVISDDFVATDDLTTIMMATYRLNDYELSVDV